MPRPVLCLALLLTLCVSEARAADNTLFREMKGASVAVVPPSTIHVRGEGRAATRHQPLQGFAAITYPGLFATLAEDSLSRGPTRWQAEAIAPDMVFYEAVETNDPDGVPPETLAIPTVAEGRDYLAVFRYAEFAYQVEPKPTWSRSGQMVMSYVVRLELDLQLVVYDGVGGEPLDAFDVQYEVEVPEIQPKPQRSKAFYRATNGALRRLKGVIRKGS